VLFLMTQVVADPRRSQEPLLVRVSEGDAGALRALYDAHASRAMAVALRILSSRADAEEVVQETFVELWKRAAQFDSARGDGLSWILTIARTRAIDRLRARNTATRIALVASAQPVAPAGAVPLELVEQRQDRERVAEALSGLPAEQRGALELAYYEGLTHREIAERTQTPLGTVKTRLRLALEKLAHLLGAES